MRIASLVLLIPAFGLAGMAAAATPSATGQCRVAWTTADAGGLQCPTPVVDRQSVDPLDPPVHHVLSKNEIRAELDAIKLDRIEPRRPASPQPTMLSSRD